MFSKIMFYLYQFPSFIALNTLMSTGKLICCVAVALIESNYKKPSNPLLMQRMTTCDSFYWEKELIRLHGMSLQKEINAQNKRNISLLLLVMKRVSANSLIDVDQDHLASHSFICSLYIRIYTIGIRRCFICTIVLLCSTLQRKHLLLLDYIFVNIKQSYNCYTTFREKVIDFRTYGVIHSSPITSNRIISSQKEFSKGERRRCLFFLREENIELNI